MSPASSQSMSRSLRPRTPPLSLIDEIVAWAAFVTGLTTYFDIGELTLLIEPSRISLPLTPVSLAPGAPPGAGAGAPGFGLGTPGAGVGVPPWPADPGLADGDRLAALAGAGAVLSPPVPLPPGGVAPVELAAPVAAPPLAPAAPGALEAGAGEPASAVGAAPVADAD